MRFVIWLFIVLFSWSCSDTGKEGQKETLSYSEEVVFSLPPRELTDIEQKGLELAQAQLDAYNNGDIDSFLLPYHDSIAIYNFQGDLQLSGKAAMAERYGQFFMNTPNLHCNLINRMVLGNTIVDQEYVSGIGENAVEVLAIYKIYDDKIKEVYYVRP